VETLGDQFLAGAPFPDDEHGAIERRGAAPALDRVEERQALADELLCSFHLRSIRICPTVGGKSHHLARIFIRLRLAKSTKFREFALSLKLARLLYGKRQV
jgi:hypothetical protein